MHPIRLRGPWNIHPADAPHNGRTFAWNTQLAEVLAGIAPGEKTVLSRHFNLPTGIGGTDRVELMIQGLPPTSVRLNGVMLDAVHSGHESRFELTTRLQSRNLLEIDWMRTAEDSACDQSTTREVRLEIHPADQHP